MKDLLKNCLHIDFEKGCGGVYGLGFVGALFFFLQDLDSFGQLFWGIIKAIVCPAILVYKAFSALS